MVAVGRSGLDVARLEVYGGDALVAIGPVVGPVAMDPGVVRGRPAARAVSLVEEAFLQDPEIATVAVVAALAGGIAADADEGVVGIGVRPAGYRLRLAVDKELYVARRERTAKATRSHRRQASQTEGLEIHLADAAAGGGGQAFADGRVLHGGKAAKGLAAEQTHACTRQGAPGYRSLRTAPVPGAQTQGLGQVIVAASDPNGAAGALRYRQGPQDIAGAAQGGEGSFMSTAMGVIAVEGDVDFYAHFVAPGVMIFSGCKKIFAFPILGNRSNSDLCA